MQKDYDGKVWKNENEKQLYINKMNQLHEECKKLKEELLKTVKLKYTFRPYIQTDPYQKWLEFSEEQRKEKNEEFQTWFKTLSDQEKLENKTELYHIFSYEDNRLKNELLKCDDLDCRMKYSAYLSTLQKWFKIIDEIE